MITARERRLPFLPALLAVLVGIQALSGLAGGIALVLDPSGGLLGLPVSVLRYGPFNDFLIPGLVLMLVLGVLPAIVAAALWTRPPLRGVQPIERAFGAHWSWVGAGVVGVGLLIWLAVELWFVGSSSLLVAYAVLAFAVIAVALIPATRRFYRLRGSG